MLRSEPSAQPRSSVFWPVFWAIIAAHTVMGALAGIVLAMLNAH